MAKKVFTLAPNVYFGRQLNKGGRNEIAWTLVGTPFWLFSGCALFYWTVTQFKKPVEQGNGNIKEMSVSGSRWFWFLISTYILEFVPILILNHFVKFRFVNIPITTFKKSIFLHFPFALSLINILAWGPAESY